MGAVLPGVLFKVRAYMILQPSRPYVGFRFPKRDNYQE